MLSRPGRARRLAASEHRFVGPEWNLLDLRLGIRLPEILCLILRECLVHGATPVREFGRQWVPHDPQLEPAGPLTTRKKRFPSRVTVGGG